MKHSLYKDAFGNFAVIEKTKTAPYKGARETDAYRLIVFDGKYFVYGVSVHETKGDAFYSLNKEYSCETWKEIKSDALLDLFKDHENASPLLLIAGLIGCKR